MGLEVLRAQARADAEEPHRKRSVSKVGKEDMRCFRDGETAHVHEKAEHGRDDERIANDGTHG